ncbi:MAG: DMT family transporter [Halofilum sp. (in: g-proteobacteria)]|nr:DMT family transporter [Halofilum sp. (in: g-proteobacteria)]
MAQALYVTDHRQGTLLAAVGVTLLSFDALLVRLADAPVANVAVYRGLFIALSLTVALRLLRGRWSWRAIRAGGWPAGAMTVTMGMTQILFVSAILHTSVANVVVILTAAPLFAAVFSGIFLREWVSPRTWLAMALCIAGILLVFGGSVGAGNWFGDMLALILAVIVGLNFTQLRRAPGVSRLAVVGGGGLVSGLAALPFAAPLAISGQGLAVLAIMGLVQMPLSLVMMTEATRYLPSAEVSLFLVVEAILGTFWVWLLLGEEPPGYTLAGGTIVIATLVGHSWIALRRERRA